MNDTPTGLAAPYCADAEGDSWLRPRVQMARDLVLDDLGESEVRGLILTGSLARGEASVAPKGARQRLLGDVEFLLIVRPRSRWRSFRRRVQALSERATHRLSDGEGRFAVEYTPADTTYLRERARPSAFTWDLRHHGRVLLGSPDLLLEIPPFDQSALPPADAMETLLNRGLELLARETAEEDTEALSYSIVKALIEAAGSALAFAGAHESLYVRRPQAVRELLSRHADLREAVSDASRLADLVATAVGVKLRPTSQGLHCLARLVGPAPVRRWLIELWRWEMRRWLRTPGADTSTLVQAYLRSEPGAARFRGWAKYAWHPLRPATARLGSTLLRRAGKGSPRRRVYAAAALAIEGADGWESRAAGLLPAADERERDILPRILETWTWLIRNN
jgi:hypothetical protein